MIRKYLLILMLFLFTATLAAQDESGQEASALLQRARQEIEALEEQIVREEARLTRIEAELVQLRREHAILSSAESAFALGEELYTAGSIVWSRDAFESVVINFPESRYYNQALFRLELISFELQDYDKALEYFGSLRQLSPGFEHIDLAIITAALSNYNLGQFSDSRQLLAQVPPTSDYGVLAEYLTAVAYVEERQMDLARQSLQGILDRSGPSSEDAALADRARIALAQILVEEGLYSDAVDEYRKISPFSPYYDVGMLGMVWTYMRLEDYQKAYNLADRVLQEVPGTELRSEFELAMANCALGAEDLDIAISKYRQLLEQYRQTTDYYDLLILSSESMPDQYSAERERLDRIRLGLAELKEEAYTQGNLDLVKIIEEEEAALRRLFVEISRLESHLSMPVDMDSESLERELNRLISYSRSETDALAMSVAEVQQLAESQGTEAERRELARVEQEVDRIRLALQDLASKFESGISQQHDWVSETQYGIAIATYMERELKRDSLQYMAARFQNQIAEAYQEGDSLRAEGLATQRRVETVALQGRIDQAAVTSADFFEEYLAHYPESRFVADVLVRLAQLYYDIDKIAYLDRIEASGGSGFVPEDYGRSINLYERVLSQYPGSEVEDVALYSLGYCLNQMGDPIGAVSKYRQLLADHPDSELAAETNVRAGDFYFDSFEFDSARVYYEHILDYPAADPDLFQLGIYKLGWTYYLLNRYRESVATFGYLIRDSNLMIELGIPRRGGAMVSEAMEYLAHDFMEQRAAEPISMAISFLDEFNDDEVTFTVLNHMGSFYEEQGYWTEATQSYRALLSRNPYSQEAPFFQARIAACYEGAGNFEAAAQAREELVEKYGAEGEWAAQVGEEYAFDAIDSLRARSLEQAITYYLGQASAEEADPSQKIAYYQNLVGRIETYLEEYGDSREAYDFRFYQGDAYYALGRYTLAGDTYLSVALDSTSSQRLESAMRNGFSSYFNAYSSEAGADSSYLRDGMRSFAYLYTEEFPDGENVDQFLFAVAANYYNVNDYPNSREAYQKLYNEYPNSEYIARAARFIAAAYEAEAMYTEAEEWYGRASVAAARTGEDLGADFELLAASAAYMDAASLAESEDVEGLLAAAARFEESARSHPGSTIAPNALYDAGETYGKAGDNVNALRVFRDLANYYPENELAPQGLLRAAFLARESENFQLAGDIYVEAYAKFPSAPDMHTALFSAAVSYEDANRMDLAISAYDQIIIERAGTADILVQAYGKYGEYLYDHVNFAVARDNFSNCISMYDEYRQGDAYFPAMSAFYLGEIARMDYDAQFVTAETVALKTQMKTETESWYGKSLQYNNDVWFMASCVRAGELYEDFANSIAFMDPPEGLTDEGIDTFYEQLYVAIYEPEMNKASDIYIMAIEKAISAGVTNEWVERAAENLELLAPGTVATLGLPGWGVEEPILPDSTGALDGTGFVTPEDGSLPESDGETTFLPDDGTTGETSGDTAEETTGTSGTAFSGAENYYDFTEQDAEDEGGGGGCFLWPF